MRNVKPPSSHLSSQRGSAIIEFLVTAVPVLLLAMGATETARWYIQKQHIRYALLEAQRAASVSHARPEEIIESFEKALKPLFVPAGQYKSIEARRDAYLLAVAQQTGLTPWRITISSPTPEHFMDFKQSDLEISRISGFPAINNNYQFEQHQEKSIGLHSQESIYEANILSVNLIYPYKSLVPGVSGLIKLLSGSTGSKFKQGYYQAGYLPMELSSHIGMQSHPVQWPNHPDSKVQWHGQIAELDKALPGNSENPASLHECSGIWCPKSSSQKASELTRGFPSDNGSYHPGSAPANQAELTKAEREAYNPPQNETQSADNNANDSGDPWSSDKPSGDILDDPLCGTSLCCV
ncbi:MAG: pilus assembly protein [Alcaligenaceae bacterium]|nr:pilus assembly protein [Alcaligenaceae bacterium]